MPTYIRPTEPKEEVTEAEMGVYFYTGVAFIAAVLTAFFVYMATGNYWWAAATFFGAVILASVAFAAAYIVAIPGEKFAQQMQKQQGPPGFALFAVPDQPPTLRESRTKPPTES